ncbi:MAG TPA: hypothetical protein DD490_25515 [Acidobacteria bacterium]|nr:hypothetical protein [Acidobacteriota bacterium]
MDLRGFQGLTEPIRLETAGGACHYLLISGSGRPIKLSATSYLLVKEVHAGRSFPSLAQEFSAKGARAVTAAEVEAAYQSVEAQIAEIEGRPEGGSLPAGFWWVRRLVREATVSRLAVRLGFAFTPAVGFPLCLLAGFAFLWALRQAPPPLEAQGLGIWLAYALFVGSLLAHELGHATACARFGAKPSDIGFTMYLIYPAFYSDVTSAWRLPRRHRVLVDIGGIFFQMVVGAVCIGAYRLWPWPPLVTTAWMIWVSILFSLNPVFRFDGYWVLADALGVTNLSKQPGLLGRHLLDRLRGRRPRAALPGPWWLVSVLALYSILAFGVWGAFLLRLGPYLAARLMALPGVARSTLETVVQHGWARQSALAIGAFLALLFLLAAAVFGLTQLARTVLSWGWARLPEVFRRPRPVAELT